MTYIQPNYGHFGQKITISTPQVTTVHTPIVKIAEDNKLGKAFKPKKAGAAKESHIVVILDASYSMYTTRRVTINGYNEYVAGQKQNAIETGIKTYVSLYQFNGSSVVCTFSKKDVSELTKLDEAAYKPYGMTNLNDAIGSVLITVNKDLATKHKKNRESVIISIITDGEENQSKTFSNSDIKSMVEKAEGKNWSFIFLGANINAFATGKVYGFTSENTMQFNTTNIEAAMRGASNMTSRLKSSYAAGADTTLAYANSTFVDSERKASIGESDG